MSNRIGHQKPACFCIAALTHSQTLTYVRKWSRDPERARPVHRRTNPGGLSMPHESKLNFSKEEILANVATREPLIVNGVKCHGGVDADGIYRSPRTAFRVPAVKGWQGAPGADPGRARAARGVWFFLAPRRPHRAAGPQCCAGKFPPPRGGAGADGAMAV